MRNTAIYCSIEPFIGIFFPVCNFFIHNLSDCAERYLSFDVRCSMFDVRRSSLRLCRATLFLVFLSCALLFSGCRDNSSVTDEIPVSKHLNLSVARQIPLNHDSSLPIAVVGGFIVADEAGNIQHLDHSYKQQWSVAHKGMDFSGGGIVENGRLFIGSTDGAVLCMDIDDGSTLWTNTMDAAFSYPPLYGGVDDRNALWLLSSDDGIIYCLNADDGKVLWKSEDTNRSDGNMVLWDQRLIYGNCDGAAHIFNAVDGSKIASIPVGESDQMAGTPVVNDDGKLFIGTRQGNLVVIDIEKTTLCSSLKISEQEAFAVPVLCGDDTVAFGVEEGDLLLLSLKEGSLVVKSKYAIGSEIEYLLYDEEILYLLANGSLMAFDKDLKLMSSLNVGDSFGGLGKVGSGFFAVKADESLLIIKGEWK